MIKFNKNNATWLDADNDSAILTRVSFNTHGYDFEDKHDQPHECHYPHPDLQLLDCSRRVQIHEFGNTREMQMEKIDIILGNITQFREDVNEAWDEYDAFWKKRRVTRCY